MVEFLYYNINPPHGNSLAAFSVDFKDFALPFSWSFPPVIVPPVIVPPVIVPRVIVPRVIVPPVPTMKGMGSLLTEHKI